MAIIKIRNAAIDLDAAEIPNLPASKITSGTFTDARIADLSATKLTGSISDARLPANALNSNVDLTNLSASNLTSGTIPTARITALPAGIGGKVLQVQNMTSTNEVHTTSSSFVTAVLTDTITPSATSSKILIIATGNINNITAQQWTYATIAKGGTNLGASPGMTGIYSTGDTHTPCTMTFLDSPSSTSELTYDVRIRVTGGTGKWNEQNGTSSLTLIEIAG